MAIIAESHLYRSLSQRDIWFKLDRAFVPRLRCYKVFVITEFMNDVLLLEGVAVDCLTKTMFKAPALIPKCVSCILLTIILQFALQGHAQIVRVNEQQVVSRS